MDSTLDNYRSLMIATIGIWLELPTVKDVAHVEFTSVFKAGYTIHIYTVGQFSIL